MKISADDKGLIPYLFEVATGSIDQAKAKLGEPGNERAALKHYSQAVAVLQGVYHAMNVGVVDKSLAYSKAATIFSDIDRVLGDRLGTAASIAEPLFRSKAAFVKFNPSSS